MAVEIVNWKRNTNFYHSGMLAIYFAVFIAFLNAAINGYDNSIFINMAALDSFGIAFTGQPDFQSNSDKYALTVSMIQIGEIAGCLFVGYISDTFGRRRAMMAGSMIIIVGVVLELATHNLNVFIFGRFVIGFGVAQVTTAAPTYTLEVAHPHFRAWATGIYNTGWQVGSIPASIILFAMQYVYDSDYAWKLPVGIQALYSGIVLIGCFFIPESPRWLMNQGREQEARAFLIHYHGNDIADHPIVDMTMNEMREAFIDETRLKTGAYAAFFKGRAMVYRFWLIIAIAFFSQYTGIWLTGGFTVIANAQFGFNTVEQQLRMTIVTGVLGFIASQLGAFYCERIGRRSMIIYGTMGFVVCWTVTLICLNIFNNDPEMTAVGVGGWFVQQIFDLIYAFCWISINALYPAEILPYSARAKGLALCQLVINFAGVLQNYVLIYGVDAWGWKFDSFFLFFNIFALAIEYFFFVETRGYSLEKIDMLFNARNPVKKSISDVRTVVEVTQISGDKDGGYYLTYASNNSLELETILTTDEE